VFRPNQKCLIAKTTERDVHGDAVVGTPVEEGCAVLGLTSAAEFTNSNTQLAASQTRAQDLMITGRLMLTSKTIAALGDQITVARTVLKVVSLEPQFSTTGALDHFVCGGTPWV